MRKAIVAAITVGLLAVGGSAGAGNVSTFFEEEIQPLQDAREVELEEIEDAWEDWKRDNDGLVGQASHDETVERARERNQDKAEVNREYVRDVMDAQREFTGTEDTRRPKQPSTPATPRLPFDVR